MDDPSFMMNGTGYNSGISGQMPAFSTTIRKNCSPLTLNVLQVPTP
jgi:hypothetical protein